MAKRPIIYKWTTKSTIIDGKPKAVPVQVPMKAGEAKQFIMSVNKWTEEQYRKQYDLFKNKLRAYESFKKAHGVEVKEQSPLEVLYSQAKAKRLYGPNYVPSIKMRTIQSFSAVSITKGKKLAQDFESAYSKARGKTIEDATKSAFSAFIKSSSKAQEIDEQISDPVKKEAALAALADHIRSKKAPNGQVFKGEEVGSDPMGADFDYSEWLD